MKKIRIEFQDGNSTEFRLELPGALTHREFLAIAHALRRSYQAFIDNEIANDQPVIVIGGHGPFGPLIKTTSQVAEWQLHLVADEFYLAAQHVFFTRQNAAMATAAQKQIIVPRPQVVRGRG